MILKRYVKKSILYRFIILLLVKERLKFALIIVANVLNSFLDIIGLGAIFTVVAILLVPEKVQQYSQKYTAIKYLFEILPSDKSHRFYLIITLTISFYIFKTYAFKGIKSFEHNFNYALRTRIFSAILEQYLHKNFLFHLNRSIEQSIKVMLELPASFSIYVIMPLFVTFINFIGLIIILHGLIYFDPLNFSLMFIYIALSTYFYYLINTRNLKQKQIKREKVASKTNKIIMESLSCIKDVKMTYSVPYFLKEYTRNAKLSNELNSKIELANTIPRYFLELFVVSGVLVLILYKHLLNESLEVFFVQLSILGVATARLLPYVIQINSAFTQFKSSQVILDLMFENYDASLPSFTFSDDHLTVPEFQQKIEVSNLFYSYPPNKEKKSLKNVSIVIEPGERIGFVGASGGGKTTLINILVGLLEKNAGDILLDGVPIKDVPNYRLLFGYIPQDIVLLNTTIKENIAFGIPPESIDEAQVNLVLQQVELADFIKEQPKGIETNVGERGIKISGGQRQRIGIARALYRNPSILVMDEATAALDNITERKIIKTLAKIKDKTFITIAHRLTTVENSDRIYILDKGELVDKGDFKTLSKNSAIFKRMLSADDV